MKEARLYIREDLRQEDYAVVCVLCHHRCRIRPGKRGRCGVEENQEGILSSSCLRQVSSAKRGPLHDAGKAE